METTHKFEGCKCLTPSEKTSLDNILEYAEHYIKDELKKHEKNKDDLPYKAANMEMSVIKYFKSKVNNTPECDKDVPDYNPLQYIM